MAALINVLGMRRSGTTMLHLMLATGAEAVACGEIARWFRLGRHKKGAQPPEAFVPLMHVPEEDFHRQALDHFGADFVVDSSKSLDWVLDNMQWAERHGMAVYNILIWKNPESQALSNWKRGQNWKGRYLRYHRRVLSVGIDVLTVNYDELVERPSETLKRICDHVGMPYFEGKENFWEEGHDFAGSSPGVRKQAERGVSRFRKEPLPPEFADAAAEVHAALREGRQLRAILEELRRCEVWSVPVPAHPAPHRSRPTPQAFIERHVVRLAKRSWLRLRWNLLQPYVVRPSLRMKRKLVAPKSIRSVESFDPDAPR